MMKCEYCTGGDHLESSCPTKKSDRRAELGMGWFFVVILAPFWILGMVFGFVRSAFKAGLEFGNDMWPQTWAAVRGKKKDDGKPQIPD